MKRRSSTQRFPLVSVCITSLNYGEYIDAAISSALRQNYPNIEVVVSDNGSHDSTFERLAAYRNDPRVRVYIQDEPVSMVANHNRAIKFANGEFIVLLSADDVLLPHHIETLMARMNDPRDPVDIVFGQATYNDIALEPLGTPAAHGILPVDYSNRDEFGSMLFIYSHAMPANLIPKSVYEKLGYFDESIAHAFEVEFALRMEIADYRIAVISDVVAAIRVHSDAACAIRNRDLLAYHREKLTYIEKYMTAEHVWRLEYLGRHVANVLEFERAMIPADKLDRATVERSEALANLLRTCASEHNPWPKTRPRVSVVVHTHGATKQLLATLHALWQQDLRSIEMIVVQTQGLGIRHLLVDQPYAANVRYVHAPHIHNAGGALRLGIELARAPYVAFIEEGQDIAPDQLDSLVNGIEANNADFVCTDAGSIRAVQVSLTSSTEGDTPFVPVQRGEVLPAPGALTFSQMLVRRNLLIGTVLFDSITEVGEQEFIEAMQFHFQYIFFERRVVTEFVSGGSLQR